MSSFFLKIHFLKSWSTTFFMLSNWSEPKKKKKKKKAPTFPSLTILKQLSTIYFRSRVFSLSNER